MVVGCLSHFGSLSGFYLKVYSLLRSLVLKRNFLIVALNSREEWVVYGFTGPLLCFHMTFWSFTNFWGLFRSFWVFSGLLNGTDLRSF